MEQDTKLSGKVAAITGGGRGIGRAIALDMAAHGAKVVVADFFAGDDGVFVADSVVAEIEAAGGQAVGAAADVSKEADADSIIAKAVDAFGRVDIVVNCAGNNIRAAFAETTEAQWDSIMDVHVKGHFLVTRAAVREMLKQGDGGRIVTVASRGAFHEPANAQPGVPRRHPNVAYSTAKAAILGMTNTLSLELAEASITVNALVPSADTQLFPGKDPRGSGGMPPTRELDPSYIAPFIVFLATDEASEITGRFVYVTGGDVCFFPRPLGLAGSKFVRKPGRWTVDELIDTIPSIAAAG